MEPREVRTACHCAGSPHEHDLYTLAAELPIEAGIAAASALASLGQHGNAAASLIGAIVRNGAIERWNLVSTDGKPLPINPDTVAKRVTWTKGGVELTNAVFEQYVNGADLAPLGLVTSQPTSTKSSPTGPTASSTSPKTRSSSRRPAPSE